MLAEQQLVASQQRECVCERVRETCTTNISLHLQHFPKFLHFCTLRVHGNLVWQSLVCPSAQTANLEDQSYLEEAGLSGPNVFKSFLSDPEASPAEVAHEPEYAPKQGALLVQFKRAARAQRAEFANLGPNGFARAELERKRKREQENQTALSELERVVEAPPQARGLLETGW